MELKTETSTATTEAAISETKTGKEGTGKISDPVLETTDEYDDVVMPSQEEDKPTTSGTKDETESKMDKSKKGRKRGRGISDEDNNSERNESADNGNEEDDEEEESDGDSVEDDGERDYDSNDSDYGAPRRTRAKRRRRSAASTGGDPVRGRHNHMHEDQTAKRASSRSRSPPQMETTTKNGKTQNALDMGLQTLGPRQSRHERLMQHHQREDRDGKRYEKMRGPMTPHFEEGHRYPFVVNKWVSVRSFGNFDEFDDKTQKLPAAYGAPMVCKKLESTLWPIGFTSLRLFHDFTGNGAMRRYICTVRADREHPPALVWRIQALDVETEYVEAQDSAVLMAEFRSRFAVLKDNPIHNSWLCDAEHFFGIIHKDVLNVIHCLPHHNDVLKLLSPESPLPELPAVPLALPKEPFTEETTTPKPKKTPHRRDSHTGSPTRGSTGASCAQPCADDHTPRTPSTTRGNTTASGLTPLQTLQEKAKLEAHHTANAFVWGSLHVPQQKEQEQQQQKPQLLSSQWDSTTHQELERLEDLLGRAEQVIYSLGETNNQLRMLNRIYAQQMQASNLPEHPIAL